MFWNNVAWIYDFFANIINRKANRTLCTEIAKLISRTDDVLECACGTGLLTSVIAPRCKKLTTTDFAAKMLKRAMKKCRKFPNVSFEEANIFHLPYQNEAFDVVVAANVIHLLDDPIAATLELDRVCKKGGRIIIPTYMNQKAKGETTALSNLIDKAGANFKHEFTFETYQKFFLEAGYQKTKYIFCKGKIPCAIAILEKTETDVNCK